MGKTLQFAKVVYQQKEGVEAAYCHFIDNSGIRIADTTEWYLIEIYETGMSLDLIAREDVF